MPRVILARLQIEDVAVAVVPVVVIVPLLQGVGIETVRLFREGPLRIGPSQEPIRPGAVEAMVFRDVARLGFVSGQRARCFLADVLHSRQRVPVTQRVQRRH